MYSDLIDKCNHAECGIVHTIESVRNDVFQKKRKARPRPSKDDMIIKDENSCTSNDRLQIRKQDNKIVDYEEFQALRQTV